MDINDAWKETCKVLLGGEIGDMAQYEKYLSSQVEPIYLKKSILSQANVAVSNPNFCKGARFMSNNEQGEYAKRASKAKLSINDVKDIDSIISAVSENFIYSGNHIIGNSREVKNSDLCESSSYVLNSSEVYESKYIAYCNLSRNDEYMFGSNFLGESKYCIKSHYTHKLVRSMETLRCFLSSDCYYSANLEGCANCLFSFNQRNRSNLIGNAQFSQEEYNKLKGNLVAQLKDELQSKKSLPMIIDILSG